MSDFGGTFILKGGTIDYTDYADFFIVTGEDVFPGILLSTVSYDGMPFLIKNFSS
jgi:hypothetical protein